VNLEAGDAHGGAKWTRRRRGLGSEKHTWKTRERCTLDEGAFGGYGGQADLTGMEDKARGVSTVSLNRDEDLDSEDTGS
jgi:hypothetical protein